MERTWSGFRWGRPRRRPKNHPRALRSGGSESSREHREMRFGREDTQFGNTAQGAGGVRLELQEGRRPGKVPPGEQRQDVIRGKPKTMSFGDTYCTNQWLSNSFLQLWLAF